MLRIHLLRQWYALSDPCMEEALHEIASMRLFARLSGLDPIPDETTILNCPCSPMEGAAHTRTPPVASER